MARLRTVYRCQECGYKAPKGMGQCPECSHWNTMIEEVEETGAPPKTGRLSAIPASAPSEPVLLGRTAEADEPRTVTGMAEFDRLLGGGVLSGQVVLLAGPPGIGKSTLMLQASARLAQKKSVLYVSGEESAKQVSNRAGRLGLSPSQLYLLSETDLSRILGSFGKIKPSVVVLDSIQTVYHPEIESAPGSVSQVRECAYALIQAAKSAGATLVLLGHVTKDGVLAGPKTLEHMVDTVLYFDAERDDHFRVLRAQKNRFGPTDELGFFEMSDKGLREMTESSSLFLSPHPSRSQSGRAVSAAVEGSRALLVEVQSLVAFTKYPLPRRMSTGIDLNRLLVLIAAMEKHTKLRLENEDVFAALSGGVRIKDPGLDLAVCMAVYSSATGRSVPQDWIFIGEVGLLGNAIGVPRMEARLREAAKAGFKRAVVPSWPASAPGFRPGLEIIPVDDLRQAEALLGAAAKPEAALRRSHKESHS